MYYQATNRQILYRNKEEDFSHTHLQHGRGQKNFGKAIKFLNFFLIEIDEKVDTESFRMIIEVVLKISGKM